MRRTFAALMIGLLVGSVVALHGQGDLSSQVLRLLVRDNVWTGLQDFQVDVDGTGGIHITSGIPSATTNRLYASGANLFWNGNLVTTASGTGTVTSVGLSLPAFITVTGSPVTTSGTLTGTLATQSANRIFAGPTTGAAAAPTFRALVANDIPDISATYATAAGAMAFTNKTGNISQWTNDSGYLTSVGTGGVGITTLGTITTGTWNGTVVAGQYGGTGVANTGKTITLGGNLVTSGAFAVTFTLSNTTNVTLPTSGTLITNTVATLSSLTSVGTIGTGVWQGTAVGAGFGGTGIASYAVGDILYASASTTLSKLADVATGKVLCSGGVTTAPSWCTFTITNATGTLGIANGGTGLTTTPTDGQLLVGKTATNAYVQATLTGTANRVTVTNGSGTITLATPQDIAIASAVQFGRLGLGGGPDATAALYAQGVRKVYYLDDGNSGTAKTIDLSTGDYRKLTMTGNCTLTLNNPITNTVYTFWLVQDGVGSRTMTWPGTVKWTGGSAPTLTVTAAKRDQIECFWDGTNYYCKSSLNY